VFLTPAHTSHLHMQSDATSDPQSHPTKQKKTCEYPCTHRVSRSWAGSCSGSVPVPGSSTFVLHRPRRVSPVTRRLFRAWCFRCPKVPNCHLHALRLSLTDWEAQMMTPANFRLLLAKSRWLVNWSVHRLHCGYKCGTRVDIRILQGQSACRLKDKARTIPN
jgi:hypothetical protein